MEADYAAFSYTFTQTLPQSGPFTTITFNDPVLVGLEGGIATGIDWRDLDISGTTTLTFSGLEVVPADSGGVNVNNFLGGPGEPASSSADFVGLSATIAAHELGHLSGLRARRLLRADRLRDLRRRQPQPLQSALSRALRRRRDRPAHHGLRRLGSRDPLRRLRTTPSSASAKPSSSPTARTARPPTNNPSAHDSMANAQPLVLAPLVVPDTDLEGADADTVWNVTAADVVGYLGLAAAGQSNTDFYSFTGQAGTLINFQVMSVVLTRAAGPFDTYLAIFNSQGQVIAYNDDSFQDPDSTIIDFTLPYTGTYYVMVTSSPKSAALNEPLTGDYELFMYTFATGGDPPAGDTMYAGSGNDTIITGTGDDSVEAQHLATQSSMARAASSLQLRPPT